MSLQEIESQALRLPPDQRAALARHLIASLDGPDDTERAWADEAARRAAALDSGVAAAVPAADVLADARRALS